MEGTGTIGGGISCETFRLDGMGTVKGDIRCERRFGFSGKLTGSGDLEAASIEIEGQATLAGRLRGEEIRLVGFAMVRGDVEAETFDAEGGFTVEGLLNAGTIDVRLQGRCRAEEIGCDRIVVRRSARSDWSRLLAWMVPLFQPQLTVRLIEGNEVDLADTTADVVRGDRVKIGSGCDVSAVEYRTELIVHPDAKVGARTRLGGEDRG
jgi:cytoskeletal protein CcmA (bactofilin family)